MSDFSLCRKPSATGNRSGLWRGLMAWPTRSVTIRLCRCTPLYDNFTNISMNRTAVLRKQNHNLGRRVKTLRVRLDSTFILLLGKDFPLHGNVVWLFLGELCVLISASCGAASCGAVEISERAPPPRSDRLIHMQLEAVHNVGCNSGVSLAIY